MIRINIGKDRFDLQYENDDLSTNMRLLKQKLGKLISEHGYTGFLLKNASYIKSIHKGHVIREVLSVIELENHAEVKEFEFKHSLNDYFQSDIEIVLEDNQFNFIKKVQA